MRMTKYRNLGGRSGVAAYRISETAIDVQFDDGGVYEYTYASAGREHVERMKVLARAGRGLCGYISRHVHQAYATKR